MAKLPFHVDAVDYYENYNSAFFWNTSSFLDTRSQSTVTSNTGLTDDSETAGDLYDWLNFIKTSENSITSLELCFWVTTIEPLVVSEIVTTYQSTV